MTAPLSLIERAGRLVRYAVVGSFVALLYTLLTIVLYRGGVIADPTWASVVAFLVSLPVSFLSHRRITYVDAARDRAQWVRFGLIALSSLVLSSGAMKLVVLCGKPYWIALACTWILVPAANYLINAVWVFRVSGLLALDTARPPGEGR